MKNIALYGGDKVKKTPFGTGKKFGEEELKQLKEALDQGTLFYWHGNKVKQFNKEFAKMYNVKHCVATSSGSAAIHVGLAVVGVKAGDEVITSPITDFGTLIGIYYQNAIPIFADLDPHTYNMDPKSIESKISVNTKAILIVHLAGNPSDMDAIMDIAKRYNLKVVEDCAQSCMTYYKGKLVGSIGDIGCFSLNDYKHMSTGDGGMCIMNDEDLYIKALKFADKNYDRLSKDPQIMRKIDSIAPNYRMSELQGAVAIAQLGKLKELCNKRNIYGEGLTEGIKNIRGIYPHKITKGGKSSYWFYLLRINEKEAKVDRDEFSKALKAEGIPNYPGYIPTCVYEAKVFSNGNIIPAGFMENTIREKGKKIEYPKGLCKVAEDVLKTSIRLESDQFLTKQDLKDVIEAINKVANYYQNK